MINRLIKTAEDYDLALIRIEELMDAEAGTPEGDELELLSTLVEMYEEKLYPIDMPDPIEAVKFRMEQQGLTQQDLVPFIGNRSKVSEVLNRKRLLTLSMMRGLNKGLGIPAEVLMQEPGADFPRHTLDLEWARFPVYEMVKRKWLPQVQDFREKAEELMQGLIDRAGGGDAVANALLRQGHSARVNAKADKYAVSAWCLRVLELAAGRPVPHPYGKGTLTRAVLKEIARLSYFQNGPLLAREYLEKHGIRLVILPHLPRTYLDGAALLTPKSEPVVGLTLRYDRIDNFWFSLLHELVHIARHLSKEKQVIVDDLDLRKNDCISGDALEKEADDLASDALVPKRYWKHINSLKAPSSLEVKAIAEKLRVHPAVIAGRIRFERNNYRVLSRFVSQVKVRDLFME